ncbi:MAG: hypothetical protein ACE5I3_10505 [Phycisphaerae bacterium]
MVNDWQMPRPGEACAACRRDFEPGETIQAYLYEFPEGYGRRDYCANCRPPDEPFAIGSWRTRRPQAVARKAASFDREAIYRFFEQLEDADTPEKRRLRFVLALLLWRKKVLKLDRSETTDKGEVWRFVIPASGETHTVERPDLEEEQLERLGAQLEGLLTGEVGDLSTVASDLNEDRNRA